METKRKEEREDRSRQSGKSREREREREREEREKIERKASSISLRYVNSGQLGCIFARVNCTCLRACIFSSLSLSFSLSLLHLSLASVCGTLSSTFKTKEGKEKPKKEER